MTPQGEKLMRGIEHWQTLVGLGLIAFAYMGGKVLSPAVRIDKVAYESLQRDSVLSIGHHTIEGRLDSLTLHQEQIIDLLKIVALDACLRRSTSERQLMQLPCHELMSPALRVR